MKTLTLLVLSASIVPAFALIGLGARREAWPTIIVGAALLAVAFGGTRYLLS